MIYSNRNSALFVRRVRSLPSDSTSRNEKTWSSRRIHWRARETRLSSRWKCCGTSSRYCERRLEPTRNEYRWWR